MEPLELLIETILIPSVPVGAILVVLIFICSGRPGPVLTGMIQPPVMAMGLVGGFVAVLNRVPWPPTDVQGRLILSAVLASIVLAALTKLQSRVPLLAGAAALMAAAVCAYVLPSTLGAASLAGFAALAGTVVMLWSLSLLRSAMPKAPVNPEDASQHDSSTDYDVGGMLTQASPNDTENLARCSTSAIQAAVPGILLLTLGTGASLVMLLGGSASFGQLAGVVCSVAGPAAVFGLIRRQWGLHPTALVSSLILIAVLLIVGYRVANVHPAALGVLSVAPLAYGIVAWIRQNSPFGLMNWLGAAGTVFLTGVAVGLAVAFQPEPAW